MRILIGVIGLSLLVVSGLYWQGFLGGSPAREETASHGSLFKRDAAVPADLATALQTMTATADGATGSQELLVGLETPSVQELAKKLHAEPDQSAHLIHAHLTALELDNFKTAKELLLLTLRMQNKDPKLSEMAFEELQEGARHKLPPARSEVIYRLGLFQVLTRSAAGNSNGFQKVLRAIEAEPVAETQKMMFALATKELPHESAALQELQERLHARPESPSAGE